MVDWLVCSMDGWLDDLVGLFIGQLIGLFVSSTRLYNIC
jgi:hypothetical protein